LKANNKYLEHVLKVTTQGEKRLEEVLTDAKGDVYAFRGTESPVLVAAAMARLSRRGDDMRITYLDEFAGQDQGADDLIKRVVTAYGDDSVQQLVGVHVVVENASNLLTKLLEWGRLGSYLEQSTRYIYFDETDLNGQYRYYTPDTLKGETRERYISSMDQIFKLYSKLVRELTDYVRVKHPKPADIKERAAWSGATRAQACDAIRPLLPVATKSTVGIFASAQAIESLIMHLRSEELSEAREVGDQILREVRKVIPAFLERTDLPERGGATTAYRATTRTDLAKLAAKYLPVKPENSTDDVKLLSYWPKDENKLVPEILFEHTNLPLRTIRDEVSRWGEEQKKEVLRTAIGERLNRRHKPGRAFEIAHYEFEITADYGSFRDLQRHRMVDAFEWQKLSPAFGYEVPDLVKEAGLEEQFVHCFNISKRLYSTLVEARHETEAQYAVLLGNRMRWRWVLNARALFHLLELRTSPQGHPGYRKICKQMHESIKSVHPTIAEAMIFVNKDEDPELTRLAAERATQYKLEKLDKQS